MPAPYRSGTVATRRGFVRIRTHRLEYAWIEPVTPPPGVRPILVFLHDALGSVSAWQDFPHRVASTTGCKAIVYSRSGHGQSDVRGAPLRADYLHIEARVELPELLLHTRVENPVLVGDREGAAIALIHAASGFTVRGIVGLSPRIRIEEGMLAAVRAVRAQLDSGRLPSDLARHHRDPDALVRAWSDVWLDPGMREWSLDPLLPRIGCPMLVLQGEDDRSGSLGQLVAITRGVRARVDSIALSGVADIAWREAPDAICTGIAAFVDAVA